MAKISDTNVGYHNMRLKNFWRKSWIKGRTPEIWNEILKHNNSNHSLNKLKDALYKLYLEGRIKTQAERESLVEMLDSSDEENRFLALSIMSILKPKVFIPKEKSK